MAWRTRQGSVTDEENPLQRKLPVNEYFVQNNASPSPQAANKGPLD